MSSVLVLVSFHIYFDFKLFSNFGFTKKLFIFKNVYANNTRLRKEENKKTRKVKMNKNETITGRKLVF
jgi:hypothetical protein